MRQSEAWAIVGNQGRYQWFLLSLLLISKSFVAFQICLPVVTEMSQEAADDAAGTKNNSITSIRTEWGVSKHVTEISKALFWLGVIIGNSVLGNMADKHGRKKMFCWDFGINIVIAILTAFSPHWTLYLLGRFLTGIFQGGMFVTIFTMACELFGKPLWGIIGATINAFWALGMPLLGYIGYTVKSWRAVMLYTSVPFIPVLLLIWYLVPESSLWLCSVGRTEEAEVILRDLARKNGRAKWHLIEDLELDNDSGKVLKQTISTAIRNMEYRRRMKRIMASWFLAGITAYYITYSADHLGGTVYFNIAFQGVVEFPTDLGIGIFLQMFNRRPLLYLFWIINNIMLLFLAIAPHYITELQDHTSTLKLVFAMIAKGAIAAVFNTVWLWSGELFPTSLRASSVGLGSMVARVGAMLSPFLFELGDTIPLYTLAGLGMVVSYYTFGLPETFGADALERLEDLKGTAIPFDEQKQQLIDSDASFAESDTDRNADDEESHVDQREIKRHTWV